MNGQEKGSCCNAEMAKGIAILVAGIICMAFAYKIILHALIFGIGLVLMYYGLAIMKMENVKKWIDEFMKKVRDLMPELK